MYQEHCIPWIFVGFSKKSFDWINAHCLPLHSISSYPVTSYLDLTHAVSTVIMVTHTLEPVTPLLKIFHWLISFFETKFLRQKLTLSSRFLSCSWAFPSFLDKVLKVPDCARSSLLWKVLFPLTFPSPLCLSSFFKNKLKNMLATALKYEPTHPRQRSVLHLLNTEASFHFLLSLQLSRVLSFHFCWAPFRSS